MSKDKDKKISIMDSDIEEETPKKPSGKRWKITPLVPSAKKAVLRGKELGEELEIADEKDPRWGKINALARIKMVKVEVVK